MPAEKLRPGLLLRLIFLSLFLSALSLSWAFYKATRPLSRPPGDSLLPERDLKEVLEKGIDKQYAVTLSEAEINQWLERSLTLKQVGFCSGFVSLKRVWVTFENDIAEVVLEREIFGKSQTISMYLQVLKVQTDHGTETTVNRSGGPMLELVPSIKSGGRIGELVVPQGFLLLAMPSYAQLAAAVEEELNLGIGEMAKVTFKHGEVILDPRPPDTPPVSPF